jgi:hypothetical protein
MQSHLDQVCPQGLVWGVEPVTFTFVTKGGRPVTGAWWLVFLDDATQAEKMAFYDLTEEGLPIFKVFVKTTLDDEVIVSLAATHELVEMAVDPWLNSAYQDQQGAFWAAEIADPVQAGRYGYQIGDVLVTNFVTPNWFGHQHAGMTFDFQKHVRGPFEVLSDGYARCFDSQQRKWFQVTGSDAGRRKMVTDPPVGSRRERRDRQLTTPPKLSTPDWQESRWLPPSA